MWIGYVSCGSGHKKAAQAIHQVLSPGTSFLFDLMDFSPGVVKFIYEQGYKLLVKYLPFIWRFIYFIYSYSFFSRILLFSHRLIFRSFLKKIIKENPQVVISTHFFFSQLVSFLKQKKLLDCRHITVVTDYGVYPLWVNKDTDYYIAATEKVKSQLVDFYKVEPDRVKVWGLPLRRGFFTAVKEGLEGKYKKPDNIFTIFLFSSEFGIGPFKRIIEAFYKKCGLIVIYADNKHIRDYIASLKEPLYLLGFDYKEEIWDLLDLCDLVVTKAGGLSISESLLKKKPMVFIHAIPGQEDYNIKFILDNGLGFNPKGIQDLIETINKIVDNPEILAKLNKSFDKINVQDCALKIKELALKVDAEY
ncbi:MAG: hypothetical protein JW734_05405 [Candidatus Omnitrophica bacterium]|nr:hypothetical protein [Candidatus Omnitrophota bacterium]